MTHTVPARREIAVEHTWNAASVFPSAEAWQAELDNIFAALPGLDRYRHRRLGEGLATLVEALEAIHNLKRRSEIVFYFAEMAYYVDTTAPDGGKRFGQAQGLQGQVAAAAAFLNPELLAIGESVLRGWAKEEPRLAVYSHYFDSLFRQQAHVRPADVEEVLGLLKDPLKNVETTASMLTNAELKFPPATAGDGSPLPLAQGVLNKILSSADRQARRTAWENYTDTYLAFKNTLANNLITSVKLNVLQMRARRHQSTLAASLFANNIPLDVFHNLIAVFRRNLPTWHRYWAVRRKALGVEALHPYDIWAPLTRHNPVIPYPQAVEWICQALAPLGENYVRVLRRGCFEDRWVDIYPNLGKMAGAFSTGSQGMPPFILMSYVDNVMSLSTLAHELGHSMHSYLSWQTQPFVYSGYSLFVAEVASNFHQAMTRAYLFDHNDDPALQMVLIEEAMANFHRYFFVMPTLARFELEVHQRVERGQGVVADDMMALMADLFDEAYGGEMELHRDRVGITWATFSHLYMDYYVYQYATGIAAAQALAGRVRSEPGAAEDYLSFLRAGSSLYPLEALKRAGVDMTKSAPVEAAFNTLAGLVDKLEKLLQN